MNWYLVNRDAFALRARPFVLQIPTRAVETLWDEVTHEFVARCVGLELATCPDVPQDRLSCELS